MSTGNTDNFTMLTDEEASMLVSGKDIFTKDDNAKASKFSEKRYEKHYTGDTDYFGNDDFDIYEYDEPNDAESLMKGYSGDAFCFWCRSCSCYCDRRKVANQLKKLWDERFPQAVERKKLEYPKHLQPMYRQFFTQLRNQIQTGIKTILDDFKSQPDYTLKRNNYIRFMDRYNKLTNDLITKRRAYRDQVHYLKEAISHVKTVFLKHSEERKNLQLQRVHQAVDTNIKSLSEALDCCNQQLKKLTSMDFSAYDPDAIIAKWEKKRNNDAYQMFDIILSNMGYISQADYDKWSNYVLEAPVIPDIPQEFFQTALDMEDSKVLHDSVPDYYPICIRIRDEANTKAFRLTIVGGIVHHMFMHRVVLQYM